MTQVDASLPSLEMDPLFGDTLPVLPYDSFTGGRNIFFHEGLQAPSQADSGSLGASDSVPQSSESPTYVNESQAPKKGRGAKKGNSKPKDSEQLERIRAKNRRAQVRYRAKLRAQAQHTMQTHEEVAEELARLRLENAALMHSNDLMDRVLTVREGYMASLKGSAMASAPETALAPGTVTDSRRPPMRLAEIDCDSIKQLGGAAPPRPLAPVFAVPELQGDEPDLKPALVEGRGAYADYILGASGGAGAGLGTAGSRAPVPRCGLTGLDAAEVDCIKRSDPASVVTAWKALVPQLEDALQMLAAAGSDAGAREAAEAVLGDALREARVYCFEHAVYKPSNIQQLLAANLGVSGAAPAAAAGAVKAGGAVAHASSKGAIVADASGTAAVPAAPAPAGGDAAHWAFVASELQLSDEQRAALIPLRDVFLRRIGRVMEERRAILGQLSAVTPTDSLQALQQTTAEWLRVNRATSELSANLQQEHLVCMEFVSRGFGGVLSPQQKAVAIVRSYPYFPDIYSIATACSGRPDAVAPMLEASRQAGDIMLQERS